MTFRYITQVNILLQALYLGILLTAGNAVWNACLGAKVEYTNGGEVLEEKMLKDRLQVTSLQNYTNYKRKLSIRCFARWIVLIPLAMIDIGSCVLTRNLVYNMTNGESWWQLKSRYICFNQKQAVKHYAVYLTNSEMKDKFVAKYRVVLQNVRKWLKIVKKIQKSTFSDQK